MAIISIQLYRPHIRAALVFCGQRDIRYYLNGICFECFPDRCFIAATDGSRMAIIRDNGELACSPEAAPEGTTFIVPRELLDNVKSNIQDPTIGISYDTESCMVTIRDGITQSTKRASEGKYPDYRCAVPQTLSGIPDQIAAETATDLGRIARILGCRSSSSVLIFHNASPNPTAAGGGNIVEIEGHPEFLGIVMGTRDIRRTPRADLTTFLSRSNTAESVTSVQAVTHSVQITEHPQAVAA